jgi:hypothetical protein
LVVRDANRSHVDDQRHSEGTLGSDRVTPPAVMSLRRITGCSEKNGTTRSDKAALNVKSCEPGRSRSKKGCLPGRLTATRGESRNAILATLT